MIADVISRVRARDFDVAVKVRAPTTRTMNGSNQLNADGAIPQRCEVKWVFALVNFDVICFWGWWVGLGICIE